MCTNKSKSGQSEALVTATSLSKYFGSQQVLKNVDLAVRKGDVVALIGPSGSGKSTLLRCLNLLEKPTQGELTVCGLSYNCSKKSRPTKEREITRRTGMVFQNLNLFPHLTVIQNITLAQQRVLKRTKNNANERAEELLTRVGLKEKAGSYPRTCSGGEQQRIAIARALALDPSLMLFDEPTSALDPELGLEVLSVMRELADGGMTMVVATHEMNFAKDVADKVVVMSAGEVIETSNPNTIFSRPEKERTRQFLQAVLDR